MVFGYLQFNFNVWGEEIEDEKLMKHENVRW